MHHYYITSGIDADKIRAEAIEKKKKEDVVIHFHPYDEGVCTGVTEEATHELHFKKGI